MKSLHQEEEKTRMLDSKIQVMQEHYATTSLSRRMNFTFPEVLSFISLHMYSLSPLTKALLKTHRSGFPFNKYIFPAKINSKLVFQFFFLHERRKRKKEETRIAERGEVG
tara:strand:+ start:1216 stop:1545 length:330 start_codon:yes stop_codon:yes gene_type:complete